VGAIRRKERRAFGGFWEKKKKKILRKKNDGLGGGVWASDVRRTEMCQVADIALVRGPQGEAGGAWILGGEGGVKGGGGGGVYSNIEANLNCVVNEGRK